MNTVEGALQEGGVLKQNGSYVINVPEGTASGSRVKLGYDIPAFDLAIATREVAADLDGDGNSVSLEVSPPSQTEKVNYKSLSVQAFSITGTITKTLRIRINTFKQIRGDDGGTQWATVSYVDEKNAELTTELGNVEAEVQDAYTMAETADTNAASAKTDASKAKSDASSALNQIGSKSSAVKFANLWATIGAWAEAVPMTERINPAYSWSWNNRSAINGSADYPTDKATINARLTELEEGGNRQKIVSGSTTVTVTTGKETVIDYADAGFTAVPQVLVTYSTTGSNPSPTGIIKVFDKTTTGCKITVSSGTANERYPIDWMATGK